MNPHPILRPRRVLRELRARQLSTLDKLNLSDPRVAEIATDVISLGQGVRSALAPFAPVPPTKTSPPYARQ